MSAAATPIGVGMLGYGFMGRAHALAFRRTAELGLDIPVALRTVSGRDAVAVAEAARRLGFGRAVGDWRELIADPEVELFDDTGPNDMHAGPTIAAAAAGKHLLCEKPLARDAAESRAMLGAARAAGVVHMCGFNYRFLPAVRLARELLEAGELGEIRHFRATYLQDWGLDPAAAGWRFDRERAGSGALGDLGSHIVDLGRYLLGEEIASVSGVLATFTSERGGEEVTVDDAFEATVVFEGGATGTLSASRMSPGRANQLRFEVAGSRGTLAFDLERLSELWLHRDEDRRLAGPRRILVTGPGHPFAELWWPDGHLIGWEHSFVHQMIHLLRAIGEGTPIGPHGADFGDGHRAVLSCEAIAASAASGRRVDVEPALAA